MQICLLSHHQCIGDNRLSESGIILKTTQINGRPLNTHYLDCVHNVRLSKHNQNINCLIFNRNSKCGHLYAFLMQNRRHYCGQRCLNHPGQFTFIFFVSSLPAFSCHHVLLLLFDLFVTIFMVEFFTKITITIRITSPAINCRESEPFVVLIIR